MMEGGGGEWEDGGGMGGRVLLLWRSFDILSTAGKLRG